MLRERKEILEERCSQLGESKATCRESPTERKEYDFEIDLYRSIIVHCYVPRGLTREHEEPRCKLQVVTRAKIAWHFCLVGLLCLQEESRGFVVVHCWQTIESIDHRADNCS